MGRIIGGVVLGYLSMFVIVFISLTASFLMLGVDKVFQPGTYDVTVLWLAVMALFSLLAAIAGGWVCVTFAKKKGAVTGLLVMVLVLGFLSALPALFDSSPKAVRNGDVPNLQAMANGREPIWYALLLPVIGVTGVWIGGRTFSRQT